MNVDNYIKSSYTFKEIFEFQKLPLEVKEQISARVIKTALGLCKHVPAIAFSGGKDSEVVSDLIERNFPEQFKNVHCIFGNTGIEFPESLKFARKYGVAHYGERFHETKLTKLKENDLRYDFARQIVAELEEENALSEILKPDGKLKRQSALIQSATKRGYTLNRSNCFFAGHTRNFTYCIEQYGAPLLGKATSKLDAHRINIECFLKYSESSTKKEELKDKKVVVKMKGGEGGRTFGSISTKEISIAAKEQLGLELDKKKMQLPVAIKAFGMYEVAIKLHPKVTGTLTVSVVEE